MKTLLQLEQTFYDLAGSCQRDTLVISDRGAMDPSSCMFHGFKCVAHFELSTQPPLAVCLFLKRSVTLPVERLLVWILRPPSSGRSI